MPARSSLAVLQSRAASARASISCADHPLATALALQMRERWRRGERPCAEEYLSGHPELTDHPRAALQIIYEEFCLRQEFEKAVEVEDLLTRFPQWRTQLEVLIDCHRLLEPELAAPIWPRVGDLLGDFQLQAELGRGAVACVFLATQPALANRPMVLKVMPTDAQEHLSLARLQHTGIVPLYWVFDEPARHLRVLCMPYFGGAALSDVLKRLRDKPPEQRRGKDLLEALDQVQRGLSAPISGAARAALARMSYDQAIAFIAAHLADALHHAHERRLVHLDLKPSNVLLAGDGEPMLLDFHLAREPLKANEPSPEWLGGTPEYLSPEQRLALEAVSDCKSVPADVDGRSDIFSLGLVLYEALTGELWLEGALLRRHNPQVSVGLAAIIDRCLALEPRHRYPDAAELARELRRQLCDQPLRGVAEHGWERWRKWRRREPAALALMGLKTAAGLLFVLLLAGGLIYRYQRGSDAEAALAESAEHLRRHDPAAAAAAVARGRDLLRGLPWRDDLSAAFHQQASRVQQAQLANDLHSLAERLRFLIDVDTLSPAQVQILEEQCRAIWGVRDRLTGETLEPQVRDDLLDMALLGADLHIRLAGDDLTARQQALAMLTEAERYLGLSPVLQRERQQLGQTDITVSEPRTAWEHYLVGRSLLRAGQLAEAAVELDRAIALEPQGFWPHFYQGSCAYRLGQAHEAVEAFHVCIALAPDKAECFCNRGLAYAATGELERALRDYDRALELQPNLAAAALNRGLLYSRQQKCDRAIADLRLALESGAEPVLIHINLARIHLARNDRPAARASLQQVLRHRPDHAEAKQLWEQLRRGP
jgi:serine/threonine protein kinase/Tfp pilus assembly protein PilF